MNVETSRIDGITEIRIETTEKVALVVKSGGRERIYLPGVEGDDSGYYVENPDSLTPTENGYVVRHRGEVDDLEVISKT